MPTLVFDVVSIIDMLLEGIFTGPITARPIAPEPFPQSSENFSRGAEV